MLPALTYLYQCICVHYAKAANVNAKRKDATGGMPPNRLVVTFVFISGVAVAVIAALLTQYLRNLSIGHDGEHKIDKRIYFYNHVCHV